MLKIAVSQERFNEVIDLADSFNLGAVNIQRAYEYLCEFVVNDAGVYVGKESADKMFREARVKRAEMSAYWIEFIGKVNEAFVPKVSGSDSDEP